MTTLELIVANEGRLRMLVFVFLLLLMALIERRWSARGDSRPSRRQLSNLALVVVDTLLLRLAFPLLAVALALRVQAEGGGLFGWLALPLWLEVVLAVLLLDAALYFQHRLMHRVPLLWRLHRVHHSDTGFDVTTGVRFHPLEIAVSMTIKLGLVLALGPHPAAVVLFELLLSSASLFNHSDFAFPPRVERIVRRFLVTPSMHRIHHSVLREETDSNYGFSVPIWDRLFGSYREQAARPERSMPIGLLEWRDPQALRLVSLLLQPFRRAPSPPDLLAKNEVPPHA